MIGLSVSFPWAAIMGGWSPAHMFARGADGFWADGLNPAGGRLFQDIAGTIPVAAITDPIGRIVRAAGTVDAIQAAPGGRPILGQWPSGARYMDGETTGKQLLIVLPAGTYGAAWVSPTAIAEFTTVTSDGSTPINVFFDEWQADVIVRAGSFDAEEQAAISAYWLNKYGPGGIYIAGEYGLAATFGGVTLRLSAGFGAGDIGIIGEF